MSSSTITAATSIPKSERGWRVIRAGSSTSPRPRHLGSTLSKVSSPNSLDAACSAACSVPSSTSKPAYAKKSDHITPETVGIFLFGPRWQCALARTIGRSDRQVRRWVAGELLVSIRASRLIEELVRSKHGKQMRRLRAGYPNMIAGLTDPGDPRRLLADDEVDDLVLEDLSRALRASKPIDSVRLTRLP
jgi:hypothetical protein